MLIALFDWILKGPRMATVTILGPWGAKPELVDTPFAYAPVGTESGDGTLCGLKILWPTSRNSGMRASADVQLGFKSGYGPVGVGVLFSAERQTDEVEEMENGIVLGREWLELESAWIDVDGQKISSQTSLSNEHENGLLVVSCIEDGLTLLDKMLKGARPSFGIKLRGQRRERVFQLTRPLDEETSKDLSVLVESAFKSLQRGG